MSQLSEYLELIKNEKEAKLLPKNINYGVTIFGVPGKSDFTVKVDATVYNSTNKLQLYIVEINGLDLSDIPKTSLDGFFSDLKNLKKISFKSENNITSMSTMFYYCQKLEEVDFSNVDASKVVDMSNMFYSCNRLKTITELDTNKLVNMSGAFYNCTALSNDSLNNILAMCANATSYSGTKTLQSIGLSSYQATICTGLSNWAAAQSAGWTTGY